MEPAEGLSDEDVDRLDREQRAYILGEVWPETPNPALGGRTPIQAARAGDAETALRAAIRLLESAEPGGDGLDWGKVRAGWASRPSRPSTRATWTSTGCTCRDGR